MTTYRATTESPPLVQQALDLARRMEFTISCTAEVGRLLQVLASAVRQGMVGEIGTGCGVGAAWIMSGLGIGAQFVTVEADGVRAGAARQLLKPYPKARVIHGDWHEILEYAPFRLLFVDARSAKAEEPESLVQALRPGGLVVLDDMTPEEHWPAERRGQPDLVREFWLNDPRLNATEILLTPAAGAILATRVE